MFLRALEAGKNDIFPRAVQETQFAIAAVIEQFQLCFFIFAAFGFRQSYAQTLNVCAYKLANACLGKSVKPFQAANMMLPPLPYREDRP
jgi:hypothetical protein